VLRIQPDYTIARNNLADALSHLGKPTEATKVLEEATRTAGESRKDYPRTWVAWLSYAHMLHEQNKRAEAIAALDKAIHDYPDTWELIAAHSELLREAGELNHAVELVRPFAEQHWWHYASWMALGRVLAEKGEVAPAEAALRHASWLDIRSTDALNLTALIRVRQNRLGEAWQAQSRAVARQPDEPRQYVLLSNILDKMGRPDEARAALTRVAELRAVAATAPAAN
jgi:superkiller protein 3